MVRKLPDPDREPTRRELRLIEREWPVIAAELAMVTAECTAAAGGHGDDLAQRREARAASARTWAAEVEAPDGAA